MSLSIHVAPLGIAALAGPLLALAGGTPQAGKITLVITPPWVVRDDVIAQAGGRPIGPRAAPLGTLALFDDPPSDDPLSDDPLSDSPLFVQRLKAQGAWFVADGRPLAYLCGVSL